MRAARLLRMLLLLQNRGRMTSADLAAELEVSRRTILRDVDAMTEAGLPIIVFQGNQGGIELGFEYRTRLTGLDTAEAEAMAVILTRPIRELDELGMTAAADRARNKLLEAFPDPVRAKMIRARSRFRFEPSGEKAIELDVRVAAFAQAIRGRNIVRINARTQNVRTVHPVGLLMGRQGWSIIDGQDEDHPIRLSDCGDINISAQIFE